MQMQPYRTNRQQVHNDYSGKNSPECAERAVLTCPDSRTHHLEGTQRASPVFTTPSVCHEASILVCGHPAMSWASNLVSVVKQGSLNRSERVAIPYHPLARAACAVLLQHGFVCSVTLGTAFGPDPAAFRDLPDGSAARRLWLDLKFREHRPVIGEIVLVSKPSLRQYFTPGELRLLLLGKQARQNAGFQRGEIGVVSTGVAVMNAKEAVVRNLHSELLFRVAAP